MLIVTIIRCILYTFLCTYFAYLFHKNWDKYTTGYRVLGIVLCIVFYIIDIVLFIIPAVSMIMGC